MNLDDLERFRELDSRYDECGRMLEGLHQSLSNWKGTTRTGKTALILLILSSLLLLDAKSVFLLHLLPNEFPFLMLLYSQISLLKVTEGL